MRRTLILCATAAWVVALVLTFALTTPWSDDGPRRPTAARAQDPGTPSADAPQVVGPAPVATTPVAPALTTPAVPAPGSPVPSARYPRAQPSNDALAPRGPAPPEPASSLAANLSRCCSEPRGRSPIDAIVIHVTETDDRPGTGDLGRLARLLRRKGLATQAADDAEGNSVRLVPDFRLAYHATYWNATTVGVEQVAYATLNRADWLLRRRRQLDATAAWVAHWARLYRIPIQRCAVSGLRYNKRKRVVAGTMVRRGVCGHAQLDPRNRDDPGSRYPWDYVLSKAQEIASKT